MLRLASAALIINTVTFEQRKLIFKGPTHVQHFFPLACHIVVDSGLNNIAYARTAERPLEPYEGQLKSISPIFLLKDVVIIPVLFFRTRSPVCLCSWRRITRESREENVGAGLVEEHLSSRKSRVLFQWHCNIDTCYVFFLIFFYTQKNTKSSTVILWSHLYLSIFFHSTEGHDSAPTRFFSCCPSDFISFLLCHAIFRHSVPVLPVTAALVMLTSQSASQIHIRPFTHRRQGPPHTRLLGEGTVQTQWRGHVRSHLGFSIIFHDSWLSHSCPQLRVPLNGGLKLVFSRQKYVATCTYSRTRWSRFDNQNDFLTRKSSSRVVVGSCESGFVMVPEFCNTFGNQWFIITCFPCISITKTWKIEESFPKDSKRATIYIIHIKKTLFIYL